MFIRNPLFSPEMIIVYSNELLHSNQRALFDKTSISRLIRENWVKTNAREACIQYPGDELTRRIHLVLVSKQIFSCFISSGDSTCLQQIDITNTRLMLMTCVQQTSNTAPRQQYSTMLSYCDVISCVLIITKTNTLW